MPGGSTRLRWTEELPRTRHPDGASLTNRSGCGAAVAHLLWEQGVGSSNLPTPTTLSCRTSPVVPTSRRRRASNTSGRFPTSTAVSARSPSPVSIVKTWPYGSRRSPLGVGCLAGACRSTGMYFEQHSTKRSTRGGQRGSRRVIGWLADRGTPRSRSVRRSNRVAARRLPLLRRLVVVLRRWKITIARRRVTGRRVPSIA